MVYQSPMSPCRMIISSVFLVSKLQFLISSLIISNAKKFVKSCQNCMIFAQKFKPGSMSPNKEDFFLNKFMNHARIM